MNKVRCEHCGRLVAKTDTYDTQIREQKRRVYYEKAHL